MSAIGRILLQKSKVASVRIFGETSKREAMDDSDNLSRLPKSPMSLARHAKAVLKMQINKSDRNDAIGIARTGRPAYHPSSMLKLYVYGYLNRV